MLNQEHRQIVADAEAHVAVEERHVPKEAFSGQERDKRDLCGNSGNDKPVFQKSPRLISSIVFKRTELWLRVQFPILVSLITHSQSSLLRWSPVPLN
jgi:hypothetical protein